MALGQLEGKLRAAPMSHFGPFGGREHSPVVFSSSPVALGHI